MKPLPGKSSRGIRLASWSLVDRVPKCSQWFQTSNSRTRIGHVINWNIGTSAKDSPWQHVATRGTWPACSWDLKVFHAFAPGASKRRQVSRPQLQLNGRPHELDLRTMSNNVEPLYRPKHTTFCNFSHACRLYRHIKRLDLHTYTAMCIYKYIDIYLFIYLCIYLSIYPCVCVCTMYIKTSYVM